MEKKKTKVGRSSRTPIKHMILDKMVGKIAGVLSLRSASVPCKANPFLVVDLCGGDGTVTSDNDASPQILHKHCMWLHKRGELAELIIFENKASTFDSLDANTDSLNGKNEWFTVHNEDSRTFVMPGLNHNQAAFVHCDPNNVDQIPLTKPFLASWNRFTTYLVTLGCNVGGVKRLSLTKRKVWFDYVFNLVGILPQHHDAVLFWLISDEAQWAYLLSIPKCWSQEFANDIVSHATAWWPSGIGCVHWRSERTEFIRHVYRLFLTREEYANITQ